MIKAHFRFALLIALAAAPLTLLGQVDQAPDGSDAGAPAGGGFGGGPGGYGQGYDPTQMGAFTPASTPRIDWLETAHQQAGFTDAQWAPVRPLLQRVLDTLADYENATAETTVTGLGASGGYGNRAGFGAGSYAPTDATAVTSAGAATPADPVVKAKSQLDTLLISYSATPAQILVKLKALRASRAATCAAYVAAEKELVPFLTPRQEGMLVNWGLLE